MPTRMPISLSRLVARLSPILLIGEEEFLAFDDPVSTFTLFDPMEREPFAADSLVLGVGIADVEDARTLVRLSGGATVVVLRESTMADSTIRDVLGERFRLLAVRDDASWAQLAATLALVFGLAQETPDSVAFGDAETDLFTLANSVASLMGGPVTIEDLSFRILAFSADQANADDARRKSVLGHQVPESYSAALHEQGIVRTIYESPTPVLVDIGHPGVRPRVTMRLQAGGELLGSVWIVVDEPLSAQRQQGLIEAANVIALTMLRIRMTRDSTTRLRTERVLSLLEGGTRAVEAARLARLPTTDLVVLALGLATSGGLPDVEFEMQRLASALAMHLQSSRPQTAVALLGEVVYAVFPVGADGQVERAAAVMRDFLSRAAASRVALVGVGTPTDARNLPASRRAADLALRVLRNSQADVPAVATADEVIIDALLLRMRDLLDDADDVLTGPLRLLQDYDAEHGTQLVETLEAWLDHFGDVAVASQRLLIHKNTFRYRLRRLSELAKIDLDDPEQRFGLMLQLRLFAR